jgi:hypothetical protein
MLLHLPHLRALVLVFLSAFFVGCASTSFTVSPTPQAPVCNPAATALVLWAPLWRPDQKDPGDREIAAAAGLKDFFASSRCFTSTELRRIADLSPATVYAQTAVSAGRFSRVVVIAVRELGPVVQLLSSAGLVEGGTEVVLQVGQYSATGATPTREFNVHWKNGGPGVLKGVTSLPADMQAALAAGLQPSEAAR